MRRPRRTPLQPLLLRTQYRMPRALADFISRHVYDGQLATAPDAARADEGAVIWITSHGHQQHPAAGTVTSWHNRQEARAVVQLMGMVDSAYPAGSRVVLTPYVAQRALVEELAPNVTLKRKDGAADGAAGPPAWEVKTVDSFQASITSGKFHGMICARAADKYFRKLKINRYSRRNQP